MSQTELSILANVSPSSIGDYAACPLRAVLDADFPRPEKPQFQCYKDFGTICHWQTHYIMGLTPKETRPDDRVWESARQTPDVPNTPANFFARVELCATLAKEIVETATPGKQWKAEVKAYSKQWLAARVGRKGDNVGFGGSVDLLASDNSVLWDFKFVGAKKVPLDSDINPRFRPDTGVTSVGNAGVKNVYVWQCGSYHILTKAPKANIVWVGRDGRAKSYVSMDWSSDRGRAFADSIKGFLSFVDSPLFRTSAWPNRADHCDDCTHKDICPAWMVSNAQGTGLQKAAAAIKQLDEILAAAKPTMVYDYHKPQNLVGGYPTPPPPPIPQAEDSSTMLPPPPPPPPDPTFTL